MTDSAVYDSCLVKSDLSAPVLSFFYNIDVFKGTNW